MAKLEFARHEIEEFTEGRIWKYIVATLVEKVDARMTENNQIDPFKDPTTICRNQGGIQALEEMVDIPAIMLQEAEYESKIKKEGKEDGRE